MSQEPNTLCCTSFSPRPRPRLRVFLVTSGQRCDELKLIGWRSSYLVSSYCVVGRRRGYNEPRRMYLDGSERVSGERHHHPPCLILVPARLRSSFLLLAEPSHAESKTFKLTLHPRIFTSRNPSFPLHLARTSRRPSSQPTSA